MQTPGSVTRWLRTFQAGDPDAVAPLWERYFRRLAGVARSRLGGRGGPAEDAEDVALSAFHSFCRRVQDGDFASVADREQLWKVLVVITHRKAISWFRHEAALKRGGDQMQSAALLEDVAGREPTPESAAELLDELRHLLDVVRREDVTLGLIALRKLEGHRNAEIAAELSLSLRTIERKLERIAILWATDAETRAETAAT